MHLGRAARVRIGAQVSYRDLAGFGRRFIDVAADDLIADVVYQIGALQAIAHACGSVVSYVKPHGALYNTIVTNSEQAAAVAEAVRLVDDGLPVLGMAGSTFFDRPPDAACGPWPRRSPTEPTARTGGWSPAANPVRYCTIRARSPSASPPW